MAELTDFAEKEKKELNDILLVCMILLTFKYALASDSEKNHMTAQDMYDSLSQHFIVSKDKIEATMWEMCIGNILGQWVRTYPDGSKSHEYTMKSFELRNNEVRAIDVAP